MEAKDELLLRIKDLVEGSDLFLQAEVQIFDQVADLTEAIGNLFENVRVRWGLMHTLAEGWYLTEADAEAEHMRRVRADAMWARDVEMTEDQDLKRKSAQDYIDLVAKRGPIQVVPEKYRSDFLSPFYILDTREEAERRLETIVASKKRMRELEPEAPKLWLGDSIIVRCVSLRTKWEQQ